MTHKHIQLTNQNGRFFERLFAQETTAGAVVAKYGL